MPPVRSSELFWFSFQRCWVDHGRALFITMRHRESLGMGELEFDETLLSIYFFFPFFLQDGTDL